MHNLLGPSHSSRMSSSPGSATLTTSPNPQTIQHPTALLSNGYHETQLTPTEISGGIGNGSGGASNPVIDYEHILFQSLVAEGKHSRILSSKFQSYRYSEKMLREAAAFEVSITQQSMGENDDEGPNKRQKTLTIEEKTQLSREKNREHARNTRRRKKVFVAKLREMVEVLTQQKNTEKKDRLNLGKRIYDTQQHRKSILKLFLSYRANNVQDRRYWQSICDESITLVLPITPYRYYKKSEVDGGQRIVVGIDSLIIDTASVALMVESIGLGNPSWIECLKRGQGCKMSFLVNDDSMITSSDSVSCSYCLLCEGQHLVGVHNINMRGIIQCKFNDSNKITFIEFIFDVMGFMQQFQRAAMLDPQSVVIPNTLSIAQQESKDARIIASLSPPYCITSVNSAYWTMCKKSSREKSPHEENQESDIKTNDLSSLSLLSFLAEHSPPHSGLLNHAYWSHSFTSLFDRVRNGFPVRYHYPKQIIDNDGSHECSLVYVQMFPLLSEDPLSSFLLLTQMEIPVPMSLLTIPDPLTNVPSLSSPLISTSLAPSVPTNYRSFPSPRAPTSVTALGGNFDPHQTLTSTLGTGVPGLVGTGLGGPGLGNMSVGYLTGKMSHGTPPFKNPGNWNSPPIYLQPLQQQFSQQRQTEASYGSRYLSGGNQEGRGEEETHSHSSSDKINLLLSSSSAIASSPLGAPGLRPTPLRPASVSSNISSIGSLL